MGISARGSFDLDQHSLHSGKPLEYATVENGGPLKFVPHTIEPSIGLDRSTSRPVLLPFNASDPSPLLLPCPPRLMLAVLVSAYREDVIDGEKRVYLALHPAIAPVKATVMPLLKNNPEIMRTAEEVLLALKSSGRYFCDMDTSGAIGRRYRRADEIGTPFCLTVDFDSLSDRHVTIRSRDDCRQKRIPIEGIGAAISSLIDTL
jgi:glycyl-tRNA synthetase